MMNMKTNVKIVFLVALAVTAALLAGCAKQEAPAVPAQSAPTESESAANAIPAPEAPGTATEKTPAPAEPAADPIQQAPADKPETPPTRATATAPAQQSPAEPAAAAVNTPSVPQTAAERAKQHLDRNEFDEAIAAYTEIIRQGPGDGDAYYNRGDAYYGKGDMDRAAADWNEAIRLNSGYAARLSQNPASEAAARAQEAAESMDKALQSTPNYARAQEALSRLDEAWDF
jgi:tetratricopeptide (TPR) repeat protein